MGLGYGEQGRTSLKVLILKEGLGPFNFDVLLRLLLKMAHRGWLGTRLEASFLSEMAAFTGLLPEAKEVVGA
jgi:hypothetical protein